MYKTGFLLLTIRYDRRV